MFSNLALKFYFICLIEVGNSCQAYENQSLRNQMDKRSLTIELLHVKFYQSKHDLLHN